MKLIELGRVSRETKTTVGVCSTASTSPDGAAIIANAQDCTQLKPNCVFKSSGTSECTK